MRISPNTNNTRDASSRLRRKVRVRAIRQVTDTSGNDDHGLTEANKEDVNSYMDWSLLDEHMKSKNES